MAETLIFDEIEGAVFDECAAVGEAKLIALEGRNAAGIGGRTVVEKIAGVECGVAEKFKGRAMQSVGAGAGDDVCEAGSTAPDFCGHPTGTGTNFLDSIDVEVGESGAANFGIGAVGAVHGEDGGGSALAVDGELLSEVGSAVGVGHGARGQKKQLAEIAFVER